MSFIKIAELTKNREVIVPGIKTLNMDLVILSETLNLDTSFRQKATPTSTHSYTSYSCCQYDRKKARVNYTVYILRSYSNTVAFKQNSVNPGCLTCNKDIETVENFI